MNSIIKPFQVCSFDWPIESYSPGGSCLYLDFGSKVVQVKFADASKNKKLYKGGLDVC